MKCSLYRKKVYTLVRPHIQKALANRLIFRLALSGFFFQCRLYSFHIFILFIYIHIFDVWCIFRSSNVPLSFSKTVSLSTKIINCSFHYYLLWQNLMQLGVKLRLPGTYAAEIDKIRPPLHVPLKNVSQIFQIWSGNRIIEGNVQGGSDFHLL